MEYMTPNFTKDMVKTHKILRMSMIFHSAILQHRLRQH